jgi:hypothetical protein
VRRRGESGFALLLVFLMAAAIAITLYTQIPRVAFQSQRQKEQLLIERGEQYKRAIQLFVRANNRYPSKMEDLENFNNRRFLRHKYKDPVTGKDEWRLIHVNAAGVFTDSIANKKKDGQKEESSTAGQYVGEQAGLGVTLPGQGGPAAVNPGLRRRASEGGPSPVVIGPDGQPIPQEGAPGQPNPVAFAPGQPNVPGMAPGQPNVPGVFPGQPNFPGAPQPQPYNGGPPPQPGEQQLIPGLPNQQVPGQTNIPGQPGFINAVGAQGAANPGGLPPGVNGFPGNPNFPNAGRGVLGQPGGIQPPAQQQGNQSSVGSSTYVGGGGAYVGGSTSYVGGGSSVGTQPNSPVGGIPGIPNPAQFQQPGQGFPQPFPGAQLPGGLAQPQSAPAAPTNPALDMINRSLTQPRTGQPVGNQPVGQQIGGGIAGVASTSEDPSIMVYNDKTNYNEWEFLFDVTKQRSVQNPANQGVNGTPVQNLGQQPLGAGGANPFQNQQNQQQNPQNRGAQNSPGGNNQQGGQNSNPLGVGGLPPDIRLGRP